MKWYVVYTKPRWEKKVAQKLNDIGINAYCPLIKKISSWTDRKKLVYIPLFNSYIFVQLADAEREKIFFVEGAIRYLFWLGKPAIVRNYEIEAIQAWLNGPTDYTLSVKGWKKGDKVILSSGPFKSQHATIKEVKQNQYILILESLGCVLKVEKNTISSEQ